MNLEEREQAFEHARGLLFSIAYRMLGSAAEAEDMVQDTYVRWHQAQVEKVKSATSYLATTITRLCINHLDSARVQREKYVGPWLPEPIATSNVDRNLAESLSIAFLVLLETLSPTERAVFLLREVFDFDFAEISRVVHKTETTCRKYFSRARKHLSSSRKRFPVVKDHASKLMARFGEATMSGDLNGLLSLLSEEVTLYTDGGGKVAAALNPIYGREKVMRLLHAIVPKLPRFDSRPIELNGQPAIANYLNGIVDSVVAFDFEEDRICSIYIISNPEKLKLLQKN
jgi:RNA polymerase sigma-70 factor (ECF subfamily)